MSCKKYGVTLPIYQELGHYRFWGYKVQAVYWKGYFCIVNIHLSISNSAKFLRKNVVCVYMCMLYVWEAVIESFSIRRLSYFYSFKWINIERESTKTLLLSLIIILLILWYLINMLIICYSLLWFLFYFFSSNFLKQRMSLLIKIYW